jgi:hypothetical protein
MKTFSPIVNGLTKKDKALIEVEAHYIQWNEDNDQRRTRKNGWNDVTDAYWGKLPSDWPYINKVVDPRIRTSLIEKNARLLNAKLRGRLVPREGGDVLKARINNSILDFQWDNANYGGTMLEKWGSMDLDTRLYGSKFALVTWRHKVDEDGHVIFDGNEFKPLDIRDCGMDPTADHVRNAKWFHVREWMKVEDFENTSDTGAEAKWPGLAELKMKISESSDRRDNAYENRVLSLKGLSDRMGDDKAFPVVEIVTEYREDRWITYAPKYKVILRDIKNPYEHRKIPVIQLRYYSIQGDPLGESEVEPVLPIWKAIQATVCGYLDNMANHIRPPLKIIEGAARIETIIYGPDAQWLVDRQDAVMEMPSNGEAMKNFQTTYQALVSAFNTAMGDTSLGVSSVEIQNKRKTATEIKNAEKQQNNRDQKNQSSLSDSIQDMMSMWLVNNRQFMFTDTDKKEYILRIIGSDLFNYFQRAGLDEMTLPPESMQTIGDVILESGGDVSDGDLNGMIEAGKVPKYPVFENPEEKNPDKLEYKPKMKMNDMEDGAELSVVPEDLEGNYDYIPSIKSMSIGAEQELIQARQQAIEMITGNPAVVQMLAMEGVKPLLKDLLISNFEELGMRDADRYFTKADPPQPMGQPGMPGQPPQPGMEGQMSPGAPQAQPPMPQQPIANQPPMM